MRKSKKPVEIVYSKDNNPKAEEKLEESLKIFKRITDEQKYCTEDHTINVLKLFIEELKKIGIKFPITITNLIALDKKSNTTVLEFVTSDDVICKIVFKNRRFYTSQSIREQLIIERYKGKILITEKFYGFFEIEIDKILRFKLTEMNAEEEYASSILSFIPKTVQFELENSMLFELENCAFGYSTNQYMIFYNETNFKEIKNADQLNQMLSSFFKIKSFHKVFLFKKVNTALDMLNFGADYYHTLVKSYSGKAFIFAAETFDEDITLAIDVETEYKAHIYLYQNGDWVISFKYGVWGRDSKKFAIEYSKLADFYEENQLDTIAKAKRILKENLNSLALKLLQQAENDAFINNWQYPQSERAVPILRELAEPQIFEN